MSTVNEIADALPKLNNDQLREVERALISIYRQRRTGIIFDDAYGVWTEEDQTSVAGEALALIDAEEEKAKRNLPKSKDHSDVG